MHKFIYCLALLSCLIFTSEACWLDPSVEKNKFPHSWECYTQALNHAKYARYWSNLKHPDEPYTFYMANKHAEGAIDSINFIYGNKTSALRNHAFVLRADLCYLANEFVECNYTDVANYLSSASNLEDTDNHVNNSDEFLLEDTNYSWLLRLAEVKYDLKNYQASLYTAFLCFKRIMLYGSKTPWNEEERANAALKACFIIAKNYLALAQATKDEDSDNYSLGEIHALELFMNLAFNGEDSELSNHLEDEPYSLEEFACQFSHENLQVEADNIFYFINTKEFANLRKLMMGFQNSELAFKVIFRRARISLLHRDIKGAFKHYLLAAKYFPDAGEANAHLGNLFFIKKSYEQAYEYFQRAISLGYNNSSIQQILQLSEEKISSDEDK